MLKRILHTLVDGFPGDHMLLLRSVQGAEPQFSRRQTCKSQHSDGGICIITLVVLDSFSLFRSSRESVHQNNCCKNDQFKVCIYTPEAICYLTDILRRFSR